jgi:hypothetical protein
MNIAMGPLNTIGTSLQATEGVRANTAARARYIDGNAKSIPKIA